METKHTKGLECTPTGHIYESTPCRAPMPDNPTPKHRDYRCHRLIGSVVSCDVTPEERAANGHLFAASPDLLAVLKGWFDTKTTQDRCDWVKRASETIAKAEGK